MKGTVFYEISTKKYIQYSVVLIMSIVFLFLTAQHVHADPQYEGSSAPDLSGSVIGIVSTATYAADMEHLYPDTEFVYYASYSELMEELSNGRIDAYLADSAVAGRQEAESDAVRVSGDSCMSVSYGMILSPKETELTQKLNSAIAEMQEEGTLSSLEDCWIRGETDSTSEVTLSDGKNGVLHAATSADCAPFSYYEDGKIVGYDIAVIQEAAKRLGYTVELTQYSEGALINSVMTGKEQIALGGITLTEERRQSMLTTDSIYEGTITTVYPRTQQPKGIVQSIKSSIERSLIEDARWRQVLSGIMVTIFLSITTMILGTILGIGLSYSMQSENRNLARIVSGFSTVLDTLPVLIILMILYFVIFSGVNIPAVLVAVIGLTLYFSNTVAGILNTGLAACDKGQLEAAKGMGYHRNQIFYKIALPQALKQMYPQYVGAVTSMVKDTSIVGYITVQDLTSVSDTIRNTTYQSFFPLLLTVVIYFIIAKVMIFLLQRALKRFYPIHRSRVIRGVREHD